MKNCHHKKTYKNTKDKKSKKIIKKWWSLVLPVFLIGVIFSLSVFIYYAKDLPRPEKFTERPYVEPTRIYDRTGEVVLYTIYGEEKRDIVSLNEIPVYLQQAVVATEDSSFYSHFGIDFKGIARSIVENLRTVSAAQGGSTISQQLIRSTFLSGEKTVSRKLREIILTIELERRYSKDQIMEFYLNQVPFGGNNYGVESAAQTFFNKSVSEITVNEAAVLAAIIRSPSRLSPYGPNKDALIARKNYVLDRMVFLGFLSEQEAAEFKEEEIDFSAVKQLIRAPHFTLEVVAYLNQKYGENYLKTRGLNVYTTIDWDLQQKAEQTIKERAETNKYYGAYNSSLVALDPRTGEILAMVGSVDYFKDPFPTGCIPGKSCYFEPYPNVANRLRQPGSSFKPFVYADAFKKGYDSETIVVDEPVNYAGYKPNNYDGLFRGEVTLRQALAQSLNVPAVKVLAEMSSVSESIETARNLGITTLTRPASFYGLPLVLGGGEVTLLEMTSAYGVFATNGLSVPPTSIIEIKDSRGRIIEKNNSSLRRVLDSKTAETITDILSDNEARAPMFGPNSILNVPGVAVKTGTTQAFKDGWAIGYNSSIVVGVWSGNNNNASMINGPGAVVAAPAWRAVIEYAISR